MVLPLTILLAILVTPAQADPCRSDKLDPELLGIVDEYMQFYREQFLDSATITVKRNKTRQYALDHAPEHPLTVFGPRLRDYIIRNAGKPGAIEGLLTLLAFDSQPMMPGTQNPDAIWALEYLSREHADSPCVLCALHYAGGFSIPRDRAIAFLDRVVAVNPDRSIVAGALFEKGRIVLHPRDSRGRTVEPAPAQKSEGEVLFRRVAREYSETFAGSQAAGEVNELEHLQVGMTAPELSGPGAGSQTIKLSDYRGRGVLVLFRSQRSAMLNDEPLIDPDLNALFARGSGTILAVCCDLDKGKTPQSIQKEAMPWPVIFDRDGTITRGWNANDGSNYLIDQKGVIRLLNGFGE